VYRALPVHRDIAVCLAVDSITRSACANDVEANATHSRHCDPYDNKKEKNCLHERNWSPPEHATLERGHSQNSAGFRVNGCVALTGLLRENLRLHLHHDVYTARAILRERRIFHSSRYRWIDIDGCVSSTIRDHSSSLGSDLIYRGDDRAKSVGKWHWHWTTLWKSWLSLNCARGRKKAARRTTLYTEFERSQNRSRWLMLHHQGCSLHFRRFHAT